MGWKTIPIYNRYIDLNDYKPFDGSEQSSVSLEDILLDPDSFDDKYVTTSGIVNIVIGIDNKVAITDEEHQFTDVYLNIPESIDISEFSEDEHYYFTGTVDIHYNAYGIRFYLLEVIPT